MFSGGVGSWGAARRVADEHGSDGLVLLFTDTKIEDPDLYRFLYEAAADVGGSLEILADGRSPWEVFRDVRFIGNTRIDPCSRILKRDLARAWVNSNCEPETTTIYVGIDWTEDHRLPRMQAAWEPFTVEAPLCNPPLIAKADLLAELEARGIERPALYREGFPHNNCGGFCIKAGHAQFALLLEQRPCTFAEHERREAELREYLDKDVAILRDRRNGTTKPMTLREFRRRIEEGRTDQLDMLEWGGCGCFVD